MIPHVTATWALANFLHPILIWLYVDSDFSSDDVSHSLLIMLISFCFSTPALLLSFFGIYLVRKLPGADIVKLLVWAIVAPLLALLNWWIFAFFFTGEFYFFERDIVEPSMVAAFVAVLLRAHYFLQALVDSRENEAKYSDIKYHPDENE